MAAIVPVVAGLWGVVHPLADSLGWGPSHGRYLSGLRLAIGLGFWSAIPDIER